MQRSSSFLALGAPGALLGLLLLTACGDKSDRDEGFVDPGDPEEPAEPSSFEVEAALEEVDECAWSGEPTSDYFEGFDLTFGDVTVTIVTQPELEGLGGTLQTPGAGAFFFTTTSAESGGSRVHSATVDLEEGLDGEGVSGAWLVSLSPRGGMEDCDLIESVSLGLSGDAE